MIKVGLTGGIASGKSTVCQLFNNLGIVIIDADIIARELVEVGKPCYQAIVESFGHQVVKEKGVLNRQYLHQLIFSNPTAKQQLEQILHPAIRQQLLEQAKLVQSPYCILAIPLLVEANMVGLVDRVIVIDVNPETQLQRLVTRDGMTPIQAQLIINTQCSRMDRLAIADDVIDNNKSADELVKIVDQLHAKYLKLAKNHSDKLPVE